MAENSVYRIGFVIEQVLGHITHGQNLQANVRSDVEIEDYWSFPVWDATGLAGMMPNWTLKAGLQARHDIQSIQHQTTLDALFFHTYITALLSQNWLKRIPSVISLDATPRQYDELGQSYQHESGPDWLEQQKWRLNRNAFRAARHLVSWSYWAKAGLSTYEVSPEKVTVIPPGVNIAEWSRPEPRRYQAGPVKILFVGADLERKGGNVLLEAFRRLDQNIPAAASSLQAESPIELHLVTRTAVSPEPGLFIYNDMQPNSPQLKQLFFDSDIFCLPTFGDCLPMALAEAGAAGMPLVSCNVAAIPEIVRPGKTGYLVPPGKIDQLKNVLQRLIDNPDLRLDLGEQALQLVKAEHDAERNAQRLLDLLKSIADKSNLEAHNE